MRLVVEVPGGMSGDEVAHAAAKAGAEDVRVLDGLRISPTDIPLLVTCGVAALGSVVSTLAWFRRQRNCLLIIDARGEDVTTRFECRERTGRTIVITKEGVGVEILDAVNPSTAESLIKALLARGAAAVTPDVIAAGTATVIGGPSE